MITFTNRWVYFGGIMMGLICSECLRAAGALSPEESLRSFSLADPKLKIELVVSEPMVSSPVDIAWDEKGRLWVVEMTDYPNHGEGGRVKCLEDLDGDGRYETSRVFDEGLSFPTSILPWNKGVLVTAAPDLLFLKDNDGDGKADERRVLFTGFGTGNQQLRVNGLLWGRDGWIYGANGRSDGEVRAVERWSEELRKWTKAEDAGTTSLRGRDFRFHIRSGEFQSLAGRSQFGLAMDDWGNRFLSWNTIPVRHEVFRDQFLTKNPNLQNLNVLVDCLPRGDAGEIFPITPAPLVFNQESSSHFNALSGLTYYRGDALGPVYRNQVFMGETLRNLVHRRVMVEVGNTFEALRGEEGGEFLRSNDPWFHPVNFETGWDGALYVVDFYRRFVEHPDFVPQEFRGSVEWREGSGYGRIWRVSRMDAPLGKLRVFPREVEGWTKALMDGNGWWRDTGQRMIVESWASTGFADREWVGKTLIEQSLGASTAEHRAIALQTLEQLEWRDGEWLTEASQEMAAEFEGSRLVALKAMANRVVGNRWPLNEKGRTELENSLRVSSQDPLSRVRLGATLVLSSMGDRPSAQMLLKDILRSERDEWIRLAAVGGLIGLSKEDIGAWLKVPVAALPVATKSRPKTGDRLEVLKRFRAALSLEGNAAQGAVHFAQRCLSCHFFQGKGNRVGPDLSGIRTRPLEALWLDILDPNRIVLPEYTSYQVKEKDGDEWEGLILAETEGRLVLRLPGGAEVSLMVDRLESIVPTGRSLMPEGLEEGMVLNDFADLLAFLRNPSLGLPSAK